jgi:VWFA-related protein
VRRLARFALLWFAVCSLAQEPTTLRTTVPLVVIPASVTNRHGQFVYGLNPSDFELLDNGQPRPIRVDDPDLVTAPFDLIVLIQTSDISDSALLKIKKVGTMIQDAVVGAQGAAAVVTFSSEIKLAHNFTSSDVEIAAAFAALHSENTRDGKLLDAISHALDMFARKGETARRAILIIGESKDRGSETRLEDLLPAIQRSGVTIYSLSYSAYLTAFTTKGSEYQPPEGGRGWILDSITEAVHATKPDTCKLLTAATGGRILKFETKSKLENDLIRLGTEIHSRYMLSFSPGEHAAPGFHKIALQIRGRPELHVEARPGYWADTN